MDISVRMVELPTMHPRLLWDDIVAAAVAVLSETHDHALFRFTLTMQDVPRFGSDQIRLVIDPVGVSREHVGRLRRTYEAPRLVELAAIAITGLGLYYGVDTKFEMLRYVEAGRTIW